MKTLILRLIALFSLLGAAAAQADRDDIIPPPPPDPGEHHPFCAVDTVEPLMFGESGARIFRPALADCSTWPPGKFPLVVITHGAGFAYDDYTYLASYLAENGFVAAMLYDADTTVGKPDEVADDILALLSEIAGAWIGLALNGDLALLGHSRGGEGVVRAAERFHDEGWLGDLRAVVSLAPTDRHLLSPNAAQVPAFLVMTGSNDTDVVGHSPAVVPLSGGGTGLALYDRSEGLRAQIHLFGGIHHGFADTLGLLPDYGAEIALADQRTVSRTYVNAFLRWQFFKDPYRQLFTGSTTSATVDATGVTFNTQFDDPDASVVLSRFDNGVYGDGSVLDCLAVSGLDHDYTALWSHPVEAHDFPGSIAHDTQGMAIRWEHAGSLALCLDDFDASSLDYLSFRIGQAYDSLHNDGAPLDLTIELSDADGAHDEVDLTNFATVAYPHEFVSGDKVESPGTAVNTNYTKSAMQTVRIPLTAFAVDPQHLEEIRFVFGGGSPTGEIVLDDLLLAN